MRKKVVLLITLIFTLVSASAQVSVLNPKFDAMLEKLLSHSVNEVSPLDLDTNNIIYLDSREKKEFEVSHIDNAIWVGFDSFNLKSVKNISKENRVVVYCTVGYRSEKIAEKLTKVGFTDVSNLYGGIFEWVHHNQTVVNDQGVTEEIHTYDKVWGQWLDKGIKKY